MFCFVVLCCSSVDLTLSLRPTSLPREQSNHLAKKGLWYSHKNKALQNCAHTWLCCTCIYYYDHTLCIITIGRHVVALFVFEDKNIDDTSWSPVRSGVHPREFVFHKSRAIASDFCGIQTHDGELRSTRASMIDSISSTIFFSVITSHKTSKIAL